MKKYFNLLSFLLIAVLFTFSSCSNEDDPVDDGSKNPVAKPIISVKATDGSETAIATISDDAKTISLVLENEESLANVAVTFEIAEGAKLINPTTNPATLDLTKTYNVKVNNGATDLVYKMTAKSNAQKEYITEASVDGDDAVIVVVNNTLKTISVPMKDGLNVRSLKLKLKLLNGTTVKLPTDCLFNLAEGKQPLVLTYNSKEIEYTVELTGISIDPATDKWTDVSSAFGTLPQYIKVYKAETLGSGKNIAYAVIADGSKVTFDVLGDGAAAQKTMAQYETANAGWSVMMSTFNGNPNCTIVRNGILVQGQKPDAMAMNGTLGLRKDGKYEMIWTYPVDGKIYAYPKGRDNITGIPTSTSPAGAYVWDVKTACSGLPMVVRDGVVSSEQDTWDYDGGNNAWYDGSKLARSAVGLTLDNKIIFFASQGAGVESVVGLDMIELGQVMKDLGAYRAVSFEGSGSPDMHINGKVSVKNSKFYNADGSAKDTPSPKSYQCVLVLK